MNIGVAHCSHLCIVRFTIVCDQCQLFTNMLANTIGQAGDNVHILYIRAVTH